MVDGTEPSITACLLTLWQRFGHRPFMCRHSHGFRPWLASCARRTAFYFANHNHLLSEAGAPAYRQPSGQDDIYGRKSGAIHYDFYIVYWAFVITLNYSFGELHSAYAGC